MNEDIILKLVKSSNADDVLLAASYIAELKEPRAFIKANGGRIIATEDSSLYKYLGPRHRLGEYDGYSAKCYYKISSNYYLLVREGGISECYEAYSSGIPIIEHKPKDHE